MTNEKKTKLIKVSIAIIMSSIFIYAGHFLFSGIMPVENKIPIHTEAVSENVPAPVRHIHRSEIINGKKQEINILEVDISNPKVKILPVLSSDLIYGFEKLSSMVSRKHAVAAVNGGFFSQYGLPSGMVVTDGTMLTVSNGSYPVFYISGGKASLSEIKSILWLEYQNGKLEINKMNKPAGKGETAVYTSSYGSSNRAKEKNLTLTIKDGIIEEIGQYPGEKEIPQDGMLVSIFSNEAYKAGKIPFKQGEKIKLVHVPQMAADVQAYECGSWIVKDGKVVIGDKDEWVGVLTNNDPRTAIGIKNDGTVVLLTVDGRQPGYSAGMTGSELGKFLVSCDVANAAMLDGGASTEMIFDDEIVNKPSFKGQERPLAGGLLVIVQK